MSAFLATIHPRNDFEARVRDAMPARSRTILTTRDQEILSMLSLRVRMAHSEQIARMGWRTKDSIADCRARMALLIADGLLVKCNATAILIGPLNNPLAWWKPGQTSLDLGKLAWEMARRWKRPAQPITVYQASPHLAQRFGGRRKGTIPRAFQVSHDLAVTEMFLAIRRRHPHWSQLWIDEDRLAPFRRGEKLPDAVIAESPGAPPSVVLEFGSGNYGKNRLQSLHDDCEARGLRYELW